MKAIDKTMRVMSDHQIYGMCIVMLDDNHFADDQTATYVAAYREAERRDILPVSGRICFPEVD